MRFIYALYISGDIQIFKVFDTTNRKILDMSYIDIINNKSDMYGLELFDKIKFNKGYKFMPTCLNGTWNIKAKAYTLVGRVIEHKKKYFILIDNFGNISKMSESNTLNINTYGNITNTCTSSNLIRLKDGSITDFTTIDKNKKYHKNDVEILGSRSMIKKHAGTPGVGTKIMATRADGKCGVLKRSVSRLWYDNTNELLCYDLGKLFGVNVCRATEQYYNNKRWVLSIYQYDYLTERIYRCKDIFGTTGFHKRFNTHNIEKMFSKSAVDNFNRMVIFDLITRQTDRHIGNFAFYKDDLYPLYDNGRCLFWDIESLDEIKSMDFFTNLAENEHGHNWPYLDGVLGYEECRRLINPNVCYTDIFNIVKTYYKEDRAEVLSKYMYRVYKLILRK